MLPSPCNVLHCYQGKKPKFLNRFNMAQYLFFYLIIHITICSTKLSPF